MTSRRRQVFGILAIGLPRNLRLEFRRLIHSIVLAALLLPLAGCGPDVAKWKEEVLLHDGRMIVIERTAKAEASGFPNANRGRDLEFELKYEPLGIYWKDTNGNQQVTLEVFDGIPYLGVLVGNERVYCKGKSSALFPIRVLKMQGKEWVEVDQEIFPLDQANYNLYRGYWGNKASEDAKGLITWRHKEGEDGYPIARFEEGMAVRRPFKLREHFVANQHTCARFQQN